MLPLIQLFENIGPDQFLYTGSKIVWEQLKTMVIIMVVEYQLVVELCWRFLVRLQQHDHGRLGADCQGHQDLLPSIRWVSISTVGTDATTERLNE